MSKGKREYIPVVIDEKKYKVYLQDVKFWKEIRKRRTPRLPKYEENLNTGWNDRH